MVWLCPLSQAQNLQQLGSHLFVYIFFLSRILSYFYYWSLEKSLLLCPSITRHFQLKWTGHVARILHLVISKCEAVFVLFFFVFLSLKISTTSFFIVIFRFCAIRSVTETHVTGIDLHHQWTPTSSLSMSPHLQLKQIWNSSQVQLIITF